MGPKLARMGRISSGRRDELVKGRRYVVIVSAIGAALCIVALIYWRSQYSDTYVQRLIAWGALWLFAFHGGFALLKNLNPRLVRAIDYVYLTTAAFGVIVFALNYAEKRYEVQDRESRARAQVEIEQARIEVRNALVVLEQASCERATQEALPTYCEAAKTIREKLDVTSPREIRKALIDTYSAEIVQPTQLLDAYMVQAYKRLESQVLDFRLAALQLSSAEMSLELHRPLPRDADEPEQIYFLFEWPFILAVAFALRITRTTIEVFDWTTPVPEPPVVFTKPTGETYPDPSSPAPPWLVAGSSSPANEQSRTDAHRSPSPRSRSG
jgi:hypothetical protein